MICGGLMAYAVPSGGVDMATAGGKDLSKIDEALKLSEKLVSDRLQA